MVAVESCAHNTHVLKIERSGPRLHPLVHLVDRCMDCDMEFDRKKAGRGYDVYSTKRD